AVEREVESYDLTLRASDLDGNPAFSFGVLIGLDDGTIEFPDIDGETTLRRRRAAYTLFSIVGDTLITAFPHLVLDRDFVADFDGRAAQPFALKVPGVDPVLRSEELWYLDAAQRFAFRFAAVDQLFSASFGPDSADVQSWAVVST